jgi:hypothetical protein
MAPTGSVMMKPVAIIASPLIAEEIRPTDDGPSADVRRGWIGDDEVQVLIGSAQFYAGGHRVSTGPSTSTGRQLPVVL